MAEPVTVAGDPGTARRVAEYMNGLRPSMFKNAVPVRVMVTRGKRAWWFYGARCDMVREYTATERAVTDGGKAAGEEYTTVRYDLLGVMPEPLDKRRRVVGGSCQKFVWRFPEDDGDWYVGGYFVAPGGLPEDDPRRKFHPFGSWFSLHRWQHELPWMGTIDQHDDNKVERLAAAVEVL